MKKNITKLFLIAVGVITVLLILNYYLPKAKLRFARFPDKLQHIVNSHFDRVSQKYLISVSSLGDANIKTPQLFHAGWHKKVVERPQFGAQVKINSFEIQKGSCSSAAAMNRAGLGLVIQDKNYKKGDERYFFFFGFVSSLFYNQLSDESINLVSLAMKCKEECFILDEYTSSDEMKAQFLHFNSKPALGKELNLKLSFDQKQRELLFIENEKTWDQIKIPSLFENNKLTIGLVKIDVAHFVPPCSETPFGMKSDIEFSQLEL